MTVSVQDVVNPEVMRIPLASTSGAAATDTLIICTGHATFAFHEQGANSLKDTLIFAIPDEHGSPLSISPAVLVNSAATASLAGINGTGRGDVFDVFSAEITRSDTEEDQLFLNVGLQLQGDGGIFRVGYQVNLLTRATPPIQ
jgi:hypothetical protein